MLVIDTFRGWTGEVDDELLGLKETFGLVLDIVSPLCILPCDAWKNTTSAWCTPPPLYNTQQLHRNTMC